MDFNDRKLERSRSDRMIGGICGGLGKYLNMDPTVVRVLFVLLSLFFTAVIGGIIAYIILLFIIPEERYY